jgi:periplasmic nitrate reductase NapE
MTPEDSQMKRNVRPLRAEAAPPAAQHESPQQEPPELRRTEEFRTFIFLTVIMAPVLAVMGVGGYGFIVWVYQMFAGPPGSGLH